MLHRVSIQNYAIIETIDLEFFPNFNVITGETGAGKSILLGALGLIMGKRADVSVARDKDKKCVIEATFDISNFSLQDFFNDEDLEYFDECIIRREINTNGKSRAFINDTPVNLDILQTLSSFLLDIHAQGEVNKLLDDVFFCDVLDDLAKQQNQVSQYNLQYIEYKSNINRLNKIKSELAVLQKEYDFNLFIFKELENINLDTEYYYKLEQDISLQENAETIIENLSEVQKLLDTHDLSVLPQLVQINKLYNSISNINDVFASMQDTIARIIDELKSLQKQLTQNIDVIEYQPTLLQELQEQLNTYNKLMQKHQVKSIEELQTIKNEYEQKLQSFSQNDEALQQLEKEISIQENSLLVLAKSISNNRRNQIEIFEKNLDKILQNLGMPYAKTQLKQEIISLNSKGIDKIELYFSPNKGIEPKLLSQVGSGGEKSRLMLAIKSLTAAHKNTATLIFDEIDTGISGEVANKVAELLKTIGNTHQVIAITHLPQVAAKGLHHYFVYKNHDKEMTYTEIKYLSKEERLQEIAVMLSGENPSSAAIENAKNLLG